MAYKPAKWPTYALEALEDALSLIEDIEKRTGQAQRATVDGRQLEAVILMSDIRAAATKAHSTLIRGKTGEYKR